MVIFVCIFKILSSTIFCLSYQWQRLLWVQLGKWLSFIAVFLDFKQSIRKRISSWWQRRRRDRGVMGFPLPQSSGAGLSSLDPFLLFCKGPWPLLKQFPTLPLPFSAPASASFCPLLLTSSSFHRNAIRHWSQNCFLRENRIPYLECPSHG